jgi:hypothetical protein
MKSPLAMRTASILGLNLFLAVLSHVVLIEGPHRLFDQLLAFVVMLCIDPKRKDVPHTIVKSVWRQKFTAGLVLS